MRKWIIYNLLLNLCSILHNICPGHALSDVDKVNSIHTVIEFIEIEGENIAEGTGIN